MARSNIWDGIEWVSMTGGSGEDEGGGTPDDDYLRLDGANNPASPSNFLRTSDADLLYLKLSGGSLSGALLVPDGSASAPGLTTVGLGNAGMYKYGTNQLGFSVSSTARLVLNASSTIPSIASPVSGGVNAAAFGFMSENTGWYLGNAGELDLTVQSVRTLALRRDTLGLREYSAANLGTFAMRNVYMGTGSAPGGAKKGDIYIQY